jgi:hypothetical protein
MFLISQRLIVLLKCWNCGYHNCHTKYLTKHAGVFLYNVAYWSTEDLIYPKKMFLRQSVIYLLSCELLTAFWQEWNLFQFFHITRRIETMCLQGALPEFIDVLFCPTRIDHHNVWAPTNPAIQLKTGISGSALAQSNLKSARTPWYIFHLCSNAPLRSEVLIAVLLEIHII